jgi:hypothetical protein
MPRGHRRKVTQGLTNDRDLVGHREPEHGLRPGPGCSSFEPPTRLCGKTVNGRHAEPGAPAETLSGEDRLHRAR